MVWIIWGRRAYGRVDAHGGEHAHTVFFHLWYMPLFPTTSLWSTGPGRGFVTRWNLKSIVITYLRMWGPLAALGCFLAATVPALLVGGAFAALSAYAWSARGVRDRRRSDFNLLAFNARCEPELMPAEVRDAVKQSLDARWQKLDLDRSPDEVAQLGARSLDEAVAAYGLLRLAAVERRASQALADRILTGTYDAPPTGDGPYREDRVDAIPSTVIAQVEAAAAARQPVLAAGLASQGPWWTFSANTFAATLVVSVIALAIIVNKSSTLRGPQAITADQIAAGLGHDDWVNVDCDRLESVGKTDNDHEGFACDIGDRVLPVLASRNASLTNPITGVLTADKHQHGAWSMYGGDPSVYEVTLDQKSILFIQAIVIVSIAYEVLFAGLIGFWLVRRFRKRPSA
jgi:hypothetical protein